MNKYLCVHKYSYNIKQLREKTRKTKQKLMFIIIEEQDTGKQAQK